MTTWPFFRASVICSAIRWPYHEGSCHIHSTPLRTNGSAGFTLTSGKLPMIWVSVLFPYRTQHAQVAKYFRHSKRSFGIQYVARTCAIIDCTPAGWSSKCTWCNIRYAIRVLAGIMMGCLRSNASGALPMRPPTLNTPFSSKNGLSGAKRLLLGSFLSAERMHSISALYIYKSQNDCCDAQNFPPAWISSC